MINKKDLLNNKDFYKSLKNGEDLTSFFKELHKNAVEHTLDVELRQSSEQQKHRKTTTGSYRNGYGNQKNKIFF